MLPETVTKFIGMNYNVALEVEKGAIKRFAEAVGDPNPLYNDEEYAKKSRYGSVIAPPGYFGWPIKTGSFFLFEIIEPVTNALANAGYSVASVIDGGIEYEFYRPVRAGDTILASSVVENITERTGKSGGMVFIIMLTTYLNKSSEVVARQRVTFIYR